MKIQKTFIWLLMCLMLGGNYLSCQTKDNTPPTSIFDKRIFEGPYYNIASAIYEDDTIEIENLMSKENVDINFQDSLFGSTLLNYAIRLRSINSTIYLVQHGADPNLEEFDESNAVSIAAGINESSEFLNVMLEHSGNPNAKALPMNTHFLSPLLIASKTSLEHVKILEQFGADLDYVSPNKRTSALFEAALSENIDIVHYLLIEKRVAYDNVIFTTIKGDTLLFVDMLRTIDLPLNTSKHKQKMEVVNFMSEKGQDYWSRPIPKQFYEIYDDNYLSKY